jgi:hypothetical protein
MKKLKDKLFEECCLFALVVFATAAAFGLPAEDDYLYLAAAVLLLSGTSLVCVTYAWSKYCKAKERKCKTETLSE